MTTDFRNGLEHLQLLTERVCLFDGLSVRELAWILRKATNRTFEAGHTLMCPSSIDEKMYVILSGEVSIQAERAGQDEQIALLGPGASVGEMSLIDSAPRSATAITRSETSVLEFNPNWLVGSPKSLGMKLYQNLCSILAQRIRNTNEFFESFSAWPDASGELSKRLLSLGLNGLDLAGIDATQARLERADLRGVNLRGADFSGADLRGAIFEGTDLRETDLSKIKTGKDAAKEMSRTEKDPEYWQRVQETVRVNSKSKKKARSKEKR